MSIEEAFVDLMEADATVTGLIGSGANARCYPEVLPQNPTLPALTYNLIHVEPQNVLEAEASLDNARLQVDVWTETAAQRLTLGAAVRAAVVAASGTLKGWCVSERNLYEDKPRKYRRLLEFDLWYSR